MTNAVGMLRHFSVYNFKISSSGYLDVHAIGKLPSCRGMGTKYTLSGLSSLDPLYFHRL